MQKILSIAVLILHMVVLSSTSLAAGIDVGDYGVSSEKLGDIDVDGVSTPVISEKNAETGETTLTIGTRSIELGPQFAAFVFLGNLFLFDQETRKVKVLSSKDFEESQSTTPTVKETKTKTKLRR